MNTQLTPLQKTQAAYAHFTLEEWTLLAKSVKHYWDTMEDTREAPQEDVVNSALAKFPSAVL